VATVTVQSTSFENIKWSNGIQYTYTKTTNDLSCSVKDAVIVQLLGCNVTRQLSSICESVLSLGQEMGEFNIGLEGESNIYNLVLKSKSGFAIKVS
jgi:hypothetical protein